MWGGDHEMERGERERRKGDLKRIHLCYVLVTTSLYELIIMYFKHVLIKQKFKKETA